MSHHGYDAIVVGARCAGAPTAMLLARRGHRVLLVDKARFPSDTMSTHVVHPPGIAALRRWGLLERLQETGCPPIDYYAFDFGPVVISGSPRPVDGIGFAYCPRRTVLDGLLLDAAASAGVEVRDGFTVDEVRFHDGAVQGIGGHARGGATLTERARIVIGADGRNSAVAKAVKPAHYHERPSRMAMYYAYWRDLPVRGFETWVRAEAGRGWAAAPTHDDLTVMPFGWPIAQFHEHRGDIEGTFLAALELAPEFAERVRAATRVTRFVGTARLPGYFRTPSGPGWALVGDAGYHKNPITAMGINDAFRDAELVAGAVDDALTGRRGWEEGMREYRNIRDRAALPVYEFTDEFARVEPPPPEMQQLMGAMQGNQEAMDAFVSVQASTLPAPDFFAPENVGRIMEAAAG